MDDWSIVITPSKYSKPETSKQFSNFFFWRNILFMTAGRKTSFIKVDLPEPDTPVKQTNRRNGISTLIFFKLCKFAFLIFNFGVARSTSRRFNGMGIVTSPRRYLPVKELLLCFADSKSFTVPEYTISPPCFPAPG